MADGPQAATFQDDELDFRPAKAAARPIAASGLDFQPSKPAVRAPRVQAASPDDAIDFQPKSKPATFSGLYDTPQPGPSLAERSQRLGQPSPNILAVAPKYFDVNSVPRSPFTGAFITGPPMLTEEEKQRAGTIGPRPRGGAAHGTPYEGYADIGERVTRAFGAGAPEGSVMANLTGQRGTKDNLRLFAPEQLMTETERARHPILTGAGEFAGSFTSPEGIMMLAGTAGAGELAGPASQTVKQLLAAGFTAQMLSDAAQRVPEISEAIKRGDTYTAKRLATHAALSAVTAGLAGRGMLPEEAPLYVKGTGPEPVNAPSDVPPRHGETILERRPQGLERNPLAVEAEGMRQQRAERLPGQSALGTIPGTSSRGGEIDFEPLPEPQPINPQEVADLSERLGRPITAEELPAIRRRLDAERNIEAGLRGNRRDVAGEIREAHRATLEQPAREEGLLPGAQAATREQPAAARPERDYETVGKRLGIEYRGVMGAEYGDKAAVVFQDPESKTSVAVKVGEWSPERLQEKLTKARESMAVGELASGPNPRALIEGAKVLSRAWDERVARPLIDKVLKIGDKYQKARETDPAVAGGLHLLDNAPQYLRAKAAQEVHNVVGDLSRAQERLFTLMADADSRENLRTNHPQEYAQAQRDPAIQAARQKYKPLEQQLTVLREKMGGENLDQDYLRRVYEKHVAGVNKPTAEGKPAESGQFDRVIRPQDVNPKSREASAEYHYQKGLHEFGPAFATKFVATHLKGLRDEVAQEFLSRATPLQHGAEDPRSIEYGGKRYFRPDVAREVRDAGAKGAKEYAYYDPTAGEKFPTPAEGRYLGPKELVKALTDYGRKEEAEPSALRRFFQEQILGFGFGVPHVFNILRRVTQQTPGGAANPQAWVRALQVGLSKELRERGLSGLNDPTFDMLAKHGAISTGEVANLKEYIGGNLNPANWARGVAQIGHKALFEPGSFGGLGGIDQRARLYVADLMRSQRPDLTDAQVSRGVNDALGEYGRANWTDRQKLLGRFMMFPGWDFSSLRWVLQHPVRTTLPPALVVMLANRALHSFGKNRDEDQSDISAIHIGDRAFSTGLLRESMARNLFRPALNYAQAKIRGESNQRALDEAARGITSGAGGLLSTLRPDLSGFVALATNRESLSSGKEIVTKQDYDALGKILPSKALEKQAVFTVRRALPALDRMLDSNEDIDLRSFGGGNLGFPNYRDDAEKRLIRDTAEAERVYQQVGKLAKTNPEQARQFLKDPDNATYALFYRDLSGMTKMLNRIDQAKEAVGASKLSDSEKQSRLQAIEKARANLLTHADGLNKMLFERRQRAKPPALVDSLSAPVFGRQNPLAISPQAGAP
jgi:hypothetical protein